MKHLVACALASLAGLSACESSDDDPTVLRFAVYSDAPVTMIRATVLDEQDQPTTLVREFPVIADRSASSFLFRMFVEQTRSSEGRDGAAVRFEGFMEHAGATTMVLQRTVHARFTPGEMRLVRVWLGNSCTSHDGSKAVCPTPGFSCAYSSGACQPDVAPIGTERYAATTNDAETWTPDDYPACGVAGDDLCPNNCTTREDPDCRFDNGYQGCSDDTQCKSGICTQACTGPSCDQRRCCESRCDDACSWCNPSGQCQHLDTQADFNNCGGCGVVCSSNHNRPACQASACVRMCEPNYDDCKNGLIVDGCETNLTSDPDHCGSCAGAGAVCRYRSCVNASCQGVPIPKLAPAGVFAYLPGSTFFRQIVPDFPAPVAAVGLHVDATTTGTATLLLASDKDGEPDQILFSGTVPLAADQASSGGITYGSEFIFPRPSAPLSSYWVGFSLSEMAALQFVASFEFDPVREVPTTGLTQGATVPSPAPLYTNKPQLKSDAGTTEVVPFIYAVHFL